MLKPEKDYQKNYPHWDTQDSYEIDLGVTSVVVFVTWEWRRIDPYSSYSILTMQNFFYTVSVTYNDHTFVGTGKSETEALQNLTTRIKLLKELM